MSNDDTTNLSIPTAQQIEDAALALGLSVAALCRRADVNAELFYRWKRGEKTEKKGRDPSITTVNLQKLLDALRREGTTK